MYTVVPCVDLCFTYFRKLDINVCENFEEIYFRKIVLLVLGTIIHIWLLSFIHNTILIVVLIVNTIM